MIGVDSLGYLSVEGVTQIAEELPNCDFCDRLLYRRISLCAAAGAAEIQV